MRTPLIFVAAAGLVASTAAAANFDINAADGTLDDLSSGTSVVADCTSGLTLDIVPSATYDDALDDWTVAAVRVANADPATGLLDSCTDLAITVAIDDGDTNLVELAPVVLTATSVVGGIVEIPVPDGTDVPVGSVDDVTAMVEHDAIALAAAAVSAVTSLSLDNPTATYTDYGWTNSNTLGRVFSPTADLTLESIGLEMSSCPANGAYMEFTVTQLPAGSLPISSSSGDAAQISTANMTYILNAVAPTSIVVNGAGSWSQQVLPAPVALTGGDEYFLGVKTNCNMAYKIGVPGFSNADVSNVESAYIYFSSNLRWTNTELAMRLN